MHVELKSTKLLTVHEKRRLAQGNQTVTDCNAFEVNTVDSERRLCGAFRLTFPKPVTGPIALGYAAHFGLTIPPEELRRDALEWSTTRGSRSGRTAWQYIQDLAGRLGRTLES